MQVYGRWTGWKVFYATGGQGFEYVRYQIFVRDGNLKFEIGNWKLDFGFWFLVFGFWFLVFGFWFLVFGF